MATQLEQAHSLSGLDQPLSGKSMQEDPGDKERFYRYFQNEVTGNTASLLKDG
jgi:hypothetical protein